MCPLKEDKDGEIVPVPIANSRHRLPGKSRMGRCPYVHPGEAAVWPYRLEFPAERFGKEGERRAALEKRRRPIRPGVQPHE